LEPEDATTDLGLALDSVIRYLTKHTWNNAQHRNQKKWCVKKLCI